MKIKQTAKIRPNVSSALNIRAIVCRIEFNGQRARLDLESNRSRTEKQTFEVLVRSVKFEVRYELPRNRVKVLRTLRRGSFNSHTMTGDAITVLPGKPGFSSYGHDWFCGYPRSRSTWRGVTDLSEKEEKKQRTSVYEYLSRDGYRAVILELDNGRQVVIRSPKKPFTPEEFFNGPGQPILRLLNQNKTKNSITV